jgi:hypothetical protein
MDVIEIIKEYQTPPDWVVSARETNLELRALVYGDDFTELLINEIEKIEDKERAKARKKYSIDIRDLFSRVLQPRDNVFSADGGSEKWLIDNESRKNKIQERLDKFKGGKSIDRYLSEYYFQLSDIDPNGLLFLEYKQEDGEIDVYPTYKSIQDIQAYDCRGQRPKWVLFKPVKFVDSNNNTVKLWRFVNGERDVMVKERNGAFEEVEDMSFTNDFGVVPAVVLSPIEKVGTKTRLSWLFFIQELSKKYARDVSVKTIYEFLQGFPKHWRYVMMCNLCKGSGQKDGSTCSKCEGTGELIKNDVTDDIRLAVPTERDSPIVAPNVAGFVSPDLETLKHMEDSRATLEDIITNTFWGTTNSKKGKGTNETATGRYLDIQPMENRLNMFSDAVQDVHNDIVEYITSLIDKQAKIGDKAYIKIYGRRFIIESPDVLMEKYSLARKDGVSFSILDKMIEEIVMSKYKNDPIMRSKMLKKTKIEPYIHLSIEQVAGIFGNVEADKKVLFSEWWDKINDYNTSEEDLRKQYSVWFKQNSIITNINTNEKK